MTKKQYYSNKDRGICVRCGNRKAMPNHVMCKICNEKAKAYQRETRIWMREKGFCPRCGRNRLWGDEKICPECLANASISNKRSREKHYGSQHNYYVTDITQLKAEGLCRGCRKHKIVEGHTYCIACLAKKRERSRRDRLFKSGLSRSERYSYGLCYTCGQPLDTDKRLCSKCTEKRIKNFKGIRGTNAYWRNDNAQLTLGGVLRG